MNHSRLLDITIIMAVMTIGIPHGWAAKKAEPEKAPLTAAGQNLEARYAGQLKGLQAEIGKALPAPGDRQNEALQMARDAVKKAQAEADAAQQALEKVQTAKALVDHAKNKWIGGAEKGIAQAEAALKKAGTADEREAARKELAKWLANKEDGLKALKERQEALDKAKLDEPKLNQANQAAQAALTQARANELAAAKVLLTAADPFLANDKLDAMLVKCVVLADATPRGLAGFAQQGKEQEDLVEKLLCEPKLMKEMLIAGGAKFGNYGQAMQILADINKASPKASEGLLQRLALATSLEHAKPIPQSNPAAQTDGPASVDPVKRYLHYEKAWLDGELDPAFKNLGTWEYRMVVDCDAPDQILAWGREMLRNYRPDHIQNPDYGWRYSAAVRTDVPYGSQNVKDDLPSLQNYQNIIKDGGVCGRRAFFGRFILRAFGIPVWGVTQHAHAALSHWTPKGWVINLGAGFNASWWDKDEAPRSGSDFLLETQAREHAAGYLKVLRAQWASRALGEQAYNERKKTDGGFWSGMAHYQALVIAAKAVELGPLGQDLAEANESPEAKAKAFGKTTITDADKKIVIAPDGVITIPAAACNGGQLMPGYSGGQQLSCGNGTLSFDVEVPNAGKYALTARVVTVQENPTMQLTVNHAKDVVEIEVPYTIGKWELTKPALVTLVKGKNSLNITRPTGSRGLTLKEFSLTPVK